MNTTQRIAFLLLSPLLLVLGPQISADAALQVSGIFGDHMVIQRERPVIVWGWADAKDEIAVSFAGTTVSTVAQEDGAWKVTLPPLKANAAGQELRVQGNGENVSLKNVVVGDVWHASGQSNMAMSVNAVAARLPRAKDDIASANLPAIRFRRIGSNGAASPLSDLAEQGDWVVCTPESVAGFSAAAFYFSRNLHAALNIPMGIIDTSRGGTPIEPFIPREAFTGHPTLERELELGDANDLEGIWKLPGGVRARDENWFPGRLFNSRLAPITAFPVRGFIWYQGESNCGTQEDPRDYRHKMAALIKGWRTAMNNPTMPVYFVQLPGSGAGPGWPLLREEQRLSATLPNTGMAVTIDLLDGDIHPPNKIDVGERLARWALAKTYGREIAFSGPLFRNATIADGQVTVHFDHADRGLMSAVKKGLELPNENPSLPLHHVEVADADGQWHEAQASIEGQTLVVQSEAVSAPIAVRYAYAIDPQHCHLYNHDGLPAAPFCSAPELLNYDPGLPTE